MSNEEEKRVMYPIVCKFLWERALALLEIPQTVAEALEAACQTCLSLITLIIAVHAATSSVHAQGLLYHVMARGNDGRTIFLKDSDYEAFLEGFAAARKRYPYYLYAYVLMNAFSPRVVPR